MPSSPFRKPPPVEADLDRLHRVLAQSPSPARLPLAPPPWPDALDAPFLDVLPDFALSRAIPQTSSPDPRVLRDSPAYAAAPSGAAVPDTDGSLTADNLPSALPGRAAFDPGRRGLRALAAVAALVVAIAAYLAWQARPSVEPAPEPVPLPVAESGRPAASPSATTLVVAVTGRVRKPGLVRLAPGARVADAIEAAGGVLPDTDLSAVNLARKVTDGELIAIGVPGVVGAEGPAAGVGPGAGPVNLNTATLAQLDALPGVGPVLAQRILDHRARHGDFRSVGDLRQVEGIGESKFAQLKDLVTV
ncbi:ComEA family DNA-binding protein [Catellatospora sp. NPDC049111]|uniref:ComEA family DNA-binding protein n=1 Tax=Catellatospora sp. NPDC049111 TaxID=3155271 RepID=UPI0033C55792